MTRGGVMRRIFAIDLSYVHAVAGAAKIEIMSHPLLT
jgi:hypothetical protein